jgi:hypothetical protein
VKRKKMKKTIAISTAVVAILVLSVGAVAAAYSPGTLVGPADSDMGLQTATPLTFFTSLAPISYIDMNMPGVCDIGDYVYVDATVPLGTVSQGDIRLMDVIIGGILYNAGTQVLNLDLDVGNPLTVLQVIEQNILIVDADSSAGYSVGDWLYLDINNDQLVSGVTASGSDLRLTAVNIPSGLAYASGTKVETLDDDVGLFPQNILAAGAQLNGWRLDYVDNGGPGIYTPGDTVYCKLPIPQHAAPNVMTCDLRITEYPY